MFQVHCLAGRGETALSGADSTALSQEHYDRTERLFASSNVSLKRDGDTVKTEISPQPGNLPLVLCIAVKGFTSLAAGV